MKLTKKQIARISKILEDLGKLMFAMGVLAPVVSEAAAKISRIIVFFVLALCLLISALILEKGGE